MDKIGKSSFAFLGLGLSLAGVLILMTDALPRWTGWLGIVVGVSGFLASLVGLAGILAREIAELTVGVAYLTNLVFMSILGLRLALASTRS